MSTPVFGAVFYNTHIFGNSPSKKNDQTKSENSLPNLSVFAFVTRLFQTEGVTPEIVAVSEFIATILGEDCAGEKDLTFLTLRVGDQRAEVQLQPRNVALPPCSYCSCLSLTGCG